MPTIGTVATFQGLTNTSNQLSATFTVDAGNDRLLLVATATQNASVFVSGVTYGGQALTEIASTTIPGQSNDNSGATLWALVNPPTGSLTIVVTSNASANLLAIAANVTGAHQTTAFSTPATNAQGADVQPTISVPSASGDLVFDALYARHNPLTPGAGQTEHAEMTWTETVHTLGISTEPGGASSTTMSWSVPTPFNWQTQVGVAIRPAASTVTAKSANDSQVLTSSDTASIRSVTAKVATDSGIITGSDSASISIETYTPPPTDSTHPRIILPDGFQWPMLTGGVVDVVTRLYRSDKTGQLGEEITDQISGGSIVIDADRAIRGTCTIQTKDPDVLPRWSWVAITKEVTRESQPSITTPPDLFRIRQPAFTIQDRWRPATVQGEDLTVLLHNYRHESTYNISGFFTGHVDLGLIMLNAGITQRVVPATSKKFTGGRSFAPDATAWAIAETICAGMGWHSPVARGGTLVALENHGLAQTEPVRTYTLGEDARMIGEITASQDDSRFANVIVATSENPIRPPLRQVVKNDNPQSINSTTHPDGPGIVVEKIANNDIESDLVLRLLAYSDLLQRNIIETINLELMPDYALRIFDTILLALEDGQSHMNRVNGPWEIRSISYGLTPGESAMTVRAQRSDVYA